VTEIRNIIKELEKAQLELDPFEGIEPHATNQFHGIGTITPDRRYAFFKQKHGLEQGRELGHIAYLAALSYSEWQNQNGAEPYYAYASNILNKNLSRITPSSLTRLIHMSGRPFPPAKEDLNRMITAIATQADLTREYLRRVFQTETLPIYRAIRKANLVDKGTSSLRAFSDKSPNRAIYSGTFSRKIANEFDRKNTVLIKVPLKSVFDSWLTNPQAFTPWEDAGPPGYEYEIRWLRLTG
jgi:hypothetical protein